MRMGLGRVMGPGRLWTLESKALAAAVSLRRVDGGYLTRVECHYQIEPVKLVDRPGLVLRFVEAVRLDWSVGGRCLCFPADPLVGGLNTIIKPQAPKPVKYLRA